MGDAEKYIINGPKLLTTITEDSLGKQLYESLLRNKNLQNAIMDAATGETYSNKIILKKSCRLAESLRKCGFKQNDVIAIFSENSLDYFCPVIAALYLGIIVTTFNPQYTTGEFLHVATISKPSVIFCTEMTIDTVLEVRQRLKFIQKVVVMDTESKHDGCESLGDFINNNSDERFDITNFKPNKVDTAEQVAFILYSSGTTGLPKGVMITHQNINIISARLTDHRYNKINEPGGDTAIGLLPFFHAYGLCIVLIGLTTARRVVILKSFNPEVFLKTIQDYKITKLHIVPPLANFLEKSPLVDKFDLSSIESVYCGAAPISKHTEETLMKRLKAKSFQQGYGMTEATLGVVGFQLGENKPGSCGKVLPNASAKVVDLETGKILGPRQVGELCFKGGTIMKGYAGDVEATNNVIDKDGWLSTGDVGYYDEDEFFYIVDRAKELIKYKGFQVAPAELEAILLTHPKIIDVGVVGLPDEVAGELPVAFVVTESDESLNEEEVKDFVAKQVSPQKRLSGGVRFVSEIPKNPSGKILRRVLRELVLKQKSKL